MLDEISKNTRETRRDVKKVLKILRNNRLKTFVSIISFFFAILAFVFPEYGIIFRASIASFLGQILQIVRYLWTYIVLFFLGTYLGTYEYDTIQSLTALEVTMLVGLLLVMFVFIPLFPCGYLYSMIKDKMSLLYRIILLSITYIATISAFICVIYPGNVAISILLTSFYVIVIFLLIFKDSEEQKTEMPHSAPQPNLTETPEQTISNGRQSSERKAARKISPGLKPNNVTYAENLRQDYTIKQKSIDDLQKTIAQLEENLEKMIK